MKNNRTLADELMAEIITFEAHGTRCGDRELIEAHNLSCRIDAAVAVRQLLREGKLVVASVVDGQAAFAKSDDRPSSSREIYSSAKVSE